MLLRPFSWRDLLTLHQYRRQSVYLDSALAATHGTLHPAVLLGGLTSLAGIRAWVCENADSPPLIGISHHPAGFPSARIAYLTPAEALASPCTPKLLEQLARQSGENGAFHVLAEINAGVPLFESMRQSGFTAYTRQRIWVVESLPTAEDALSEWRFAQPDNQNAIQALGRQIIPEYILNVEPIAVTPNLGLISIQDGKAGGYAEIRYGGRGIWVKPIIHPDAEDAEQMLIQLLHAIPERRMRPLHVCIRAYQPHLEPALEAFGSTPGSEQTLMIKHLAIHLKVRETFKRPSFDAQPEAPTPMIHSKQNIISLAFTHKGKKYAAKVRVPKATPNK